MNVGTFSKIDYKQGHKTRFNKLRRLKSSHAYYGKMGMNPEINLQERKLEKKSS